MARIKGFLQKRQNVMKMIPVVPEIEILRYIPRYFKYKLVTKNRKVLIVKT